MEGYYDEGVFAGLFAFLSAFLIFFVLIAVAYLVFYFIGAFKLYKKSGKGGWECFIPFYSTFVLTEIAGLNWWWFLIADCSSLVGFIIDSSAVTGLCSIASLLGRVNIYYNLSKKFNKSNGWFILSIFFGGITLPLLGISSKDQYDFNKPVSKNGFFDKDNTVQPNNMGQQQYYNQQQPYYGGQPNYNQPQQPYYGGQPNYNQPQQPYYGGQQTQPQQPTDNPNNFNQ